jgi:hypothetical protein
MHLAGVPSSSALCAAQVQTCMGMQGDHSHFLAVVASYGVSKSPLQLRMSSGRLRHAVVLSVPPYVLQ